MTPRMVPALLTLAILFFWPLQSSAVTTIKLDAGAVYTIGQFDNYGKGADLPSQPSRGDGSEVDPQTGTLKAGASSEGLGPLVSAWAKVGARINVDRGKNNNEISARARITVEGNYSGDIKAYGIAGARVVIKAALAPLVGDQQWEKALLDKEWISVNPFGTTYNQNFSQTLYEGEIRAGGAYDVNLTLVAAAGSLQHPDLKIPGKGSAASGGLVKLDRIKVEILQITQTAPPCGYQVPGAMLFSSDPETQSVIIDYAPQPCGPSAWEATSAAPWITVSRVVRTTGHGKVAITVGPNSTPNRRTGTVLVAGKTLNVIQAGTSPCDPRVAPSELFFQRNPGTQRITVALPGGCPAQAQWKAEDDPNARWLKPGPPQRTPAGGAVDISVEEHRRHQPRQAYLHVAGRPRQVTQFGAPPCSYLATPQVLALGSEPSNQTILVYGIGKAGETIGPLTCNPFTLAAPRPSVPWITVEGAGSDGAQGIVKLSVGQNNDPASRSGVVYLTADGTAVIIHQASRGLIVAPNCGYEVPSDLALSQNYQIVKVPVKMSPGGCVGTDAWGAMSLASWMAVEGIDNKSNPPNAVVRIHSNQAWADSHKPKVLHHTGTRSGNLIVAGKTVTVTQLGSYTSPPPPPAPPSSGAQPAKPAGQGKKKP